MEVAFLKKLLFLLIALVLAFWGLFWAVDQINQEVLTNVERKPPIKIAIIDSGIDAKAADVNVAKVLNQKMNQDLYGHGTSVTSIVKTTIKNAVKGKGINSDFLFYDGNILDEKGRVKVDQIINSIKWAIEQDVDIINMSFGIQKDVAELHQVIKEAWNQNIIIIAAAGNNLGMEADYPARYPEVLSISSINKSMKHDPMAAIGKIDYVAPSAEISAVQIGKMKDHERLSGTSFAAAHATGVVATLLNESKISRTHYKQDLKRFVRPLGEKKIYGDGLLRIQQETSN